MNDAVPTPARWQPPRWAFRLILYGAAVAAIAGGGVALLPNETNDATTTAPISLPAIFPTPTPPSAAVIQRQAIIAAPTEAPAVEPTAAPLALSPAPPPLIEWSDAEKNILSWVCYGEVGGMREKKIDACYSVISTIRARYAYNSPFNDHDIVSVLERPGQFPGLRWEAGRPGPDADLMWAVTQYQAGARGSCTGYLFFDSIPGGPVLCSIFSSNNQFMDFHNGWN